MKVTAPEPTAEPWTVRAFAEFAAESVAWVEAVQPTGPGPRVLAVDGRSASGKTTIAQRIRDAVPGSSIVHTDDVAWWHSFFGWDGMLVSGVLEPARQGREVSFRPPAWEDRGREGSIRVPADTGLLIVEGVGASRRSLAGYLDAAIWVQSDAVEARRRGVIRDGGHERAEAFWDQWDAEEVPFLADDRPWERATWIVCGTPDRTGISVDPDREVLVGGSLRIESPAAAKSSRIPSLP